MALPKLSAFIRNLSKSTRLTNNVAASSNCIRFTDGERRSYSTAVHSLPKAQYGGRHTVTLIPGDGVGPELMTHVKEVLRYAGAPIDFEEVILNEDNVEDEAQLESVLLALKRNGVGLKGNIATGHLKEKQNQSTNLLLRTELDLFANVIHCKSVPGIETRHENVDIILIRENTEGEYKQLEHENVPGVVESLKIITEAKSTRIAKYAFDYAVQHNRKKVTAVHKANIMKLGDGLFLECCKKVSESYPNIEFDSMIVDNCSMQMVSKPQQFDVMVLPNLYGNIVNNIGAGLVGGAGITAGKNLGSDYAVFETGTRNTGKSIMGKNIANPSGMLLASALMLDHLGLFNHGTLIRESVMKVISEDMIHTPDLGGQATTLEVVQAVIKNIQSKTEKWYTMHLDMPGQSDYM